ncbi:hypothetical protein F0Q45_23150 [Mycobacterium simiae]|uniref:Uncharacterized protein n=1 Tax=Mycobacterium simiae TaxID=1784 RepID=A0A5B1BGM2_MYCSI|nr:hypothetical protein [Mycobacterium simiae]KAA1246650.1 hypothetical protein F0Q45_23150 [Mycobacterium simiae]
MTGVGELVRRVNGAWMMRPQRCARGHTLTPGQVLVGSVACSCGRHITWQCACGATSYGPALGENCDLLTGPKRVRDW